MYSTQYNMWFLHRTQNVIIQRSPGCRKNNKVPKSISQDLPICLSMWYCRGGRWSPLANVTFICILHTGRYGRHNTIQNMIFWTSIRISRWTKYFNVFYLYYNCKHGFVVVIMEYELMLLSTAMGNGQ